MTKEEILEESLLKLLKIVNNCDRNLYEAYRQRNEALTELHEWIIKALKEV